MTDKRIVARDMDGVPLTREDLNIINKLLDKMDSKKTENSAHGYSEGSEEEEAQRMSKQLVQNIDKQIQKIKVNAANLEHITKSGEINGSLFMDIKNLILEKEIELKRKDEEIANHIAVNSLLTDSDGEADLANQIYKLDVQLKSKDEEIQAMKEERNKAIDDFYNMMDEELQTEPINRARYMIRLSQIKESLKSDSKGNQKNKTI